MRPSPLRHTLAILRTTIGLTQKQLAGLVGRAPRTIQSIELEHLPLSEDLALRVAHETGVDESWLLQGDTSVPPRRGAALQAVRPANRPYNREDYEWQRAYNESPTTSQNMGFGRAVNVTLGLPFIRTSVDHGTALDLAGSGRADAGSLFEAALLASEIASRPHVRTDAQPGAQTP